MTGHDAPTGPNARFLTRDCRNEEPTRRPVGHALIVSILAHGVAVLVAVIVAGGLTNRHDAAPPVIHESPHITWIAQRGSESDGGGGSGTQKPAPARPMQRPGSDSVALPAVHASTAPPTDKPPVQERLDLPAVPTAAGVRELPGVVTTLTSVATDSDGPGAGGRVGSGRGPGLGPGSGLGVGAGWNNGGSDGYRSGNGVSEPRLIHEVKPGYTSAAMRARIQGTVRLQAIVSPDGSVGPTRIIRSLDDIFGLDQEALKTVRQWRFQPGTLAGRAVPVLIEVELTFTLR
jgi:protein TonB